MKNHCYRIVCDHLNLVLLIMSFEGRDVVDFYEVLRKKIASATSPISIDSYRDYLLDYLLIDAEEFFRLIEDNPEEEKSEIIKAVYECITEIYPQFNLEFVCADLNSQTLLTLNFHGLSEVMKNVWSERVEKNPEKKATLLKGIHSIEDVNSLDKYLRKNLVGQEEAIQSVMDSIKVLASGLNTFASFFFIGPTGVGKTQLSKLLGKRYSGNFFKINCAEYSASHEYAKLIGSPPGYVGHSDKSILAEKAEKSSRWVFIFDEIEKAHPKFYDFLLSLLDDGTITDNMGRVLDFSESIFIFTSNQGVSDLKLGKQLGFSEKKITYDESNDTVLESVKKNFNPEFLNRIDHFIFFHSLTIPQAKKVASLALRGLPVKKTKALLDFIVKNAYSEEYGARNIERFVKNSISVKIADEILNKRIPKKKGTLYCPKITKNEFNIIDTESSVIEGSQVSGA